jgi:hypothetical protein
VRSAIALAIAVTVASARAQGKPTNTYDVRSDGGIAAASLNDLWKLSAVVVEVHLAAPRFDDSVLRSLGMPALTYDGRIVTLLKPDQFVITPESPIAVSRIGGRVDRGNHFADYVDSSFPRFVPEKTYILFLRRDAAGRYWPATNTADSAYLIEGETVRALSRTSLSTTVSRMSRRAVLDALRRAGGG